MTFSGDLRDINLADVFQNLQANRLTGTLTISMVTGKRFVYVSEGMVSGFSLGINKGLPLANHLVQRGYIDKSSLVKVAKRKTRGSGSLRQALAVAGDLDEDAFRTALVELIEEHIYELLSLKDAEFTFTEGKPVARAFDAEQRNARIAIDPAAILMEGARRQDEMSRIQKVIGSDHDIFVISDGWREAEIDDVSADVAEWLDGRTQMKTLIEGLCYGRFEILKSVYDLVQQDLARPLGIREMDEVARDALREGDADAAVDLMRCALQTERSNDDLRARLADVLDRCGRGDEAADELAILGYHAAQAGDVVAAVEFYARAIERKPCDVALQEKRVELLRNHDSQAFTDALLSFVDELHAAGLAEKARATCNDAGLDPRSDEGARLRARLAELEKDLGNYAAAAMIYVDLAGRQRKRDIEGRLHWLHKAAALCSDDAELTKQIDDLVSGRAQQRRSALKRSMATVVMLTVAISVGGMGVVEMIASHQVIGVLESEIDQIANGRPDAALQDLHAVQVDWGWTVAGRRAVSLQDKLFDLQLRQFDRQLSQGSPLATVVGLTELRDGIILDDEGRNRLDALLQRARAEIPAMVLFEQINTGLANEQARLDFARLTSPDLLRFHLDRLGSRKGVAKGARLMILKVLLAMDDPRAIPDVARFYVQTDDPSARVAATLILRRAARHRQQGSEDVWRAVYPDLEAARTDVRTGIHAAQALEWLRGQSEE